MTVTTTDLRRENNSLKKQLRNLRQQIIASQRLEALGVLADQVSHEYRQHLAVIIGNAQLLEEDLAGNSHENKVKAIVEAANKSSDIIEAMIGFRPEQKTSPKKFMIDRVISSFMPMLRLKIKEVNPEINLKTFFLSQEYFKGIRVSIHQIIVNLTYNAVAALEKTADEPKLVIATKDVAIEDNASSGIPAGKYILIQIIDNGPGIQSDDLPKALEIYFTTKKEKGGSGLGLSIVSSLVEEHAGFFWLENNKTGGTRANVYLPIN